MNPSDASNKTIIYFSLFENKVLICKYVMNIFYFLFSVQQCKNIISRILTLSKRNHVWCILKDGEKIFYSNLTPTSNLEPTVQRSSSIDEDIGQNLS